MEITFLGAAGTVTGSKFLLQAGKTRLLIDCGLFQGVKTLRLRNWKPLPFDPASLDAVLLTHAHIDHSGALPMLVRDGFRGRIYCTAPTRDLAEILLADSGHIQEEDAKYAERKGFSKHKPPRPLYTEADAERVTPHLHSIQREKTVQVGEVTVRMHQAGHILGAASIEIRHGGRSILFSGDLGRPHDPLIPAPVPPPAVDYVVMESTYGNRRHPDVDLADEIGAVLTRTVQKGGILVVPAFAVARAQLVLYCLARFMEKHPKTRVPVWLDSPMATDVTDLYQRHHEWHRLSAEQCSTMCGEARFVRSVQESKALSNRSGPMVVVSASGMLTGGRVLHHLAAFAGDPKNTVMLPGYQPPGTRGHAMLQGADSVRIHGRKVSVRAEVVKLDGFSAHADGGELLDWLGSGAGQPQGLFLVHGEPDASDALRREAQERFLFPVHVAEHGERIAL